MSSNPVSHLTDFGNPVNEIDLNDPALQRIMLSLGLFHHGIDEVLSMGDADDEVDYAIDDLLMGEADDDYDFIDTVLHGILSDEEEASNTTSNPDFLEKLEKVKIQELGSNCSICLDEFLTGCEVRRLPCSHVYHENCIFQWLFKNNTCPLCRYQMPTTPTLNKV